MYVVLMRSKIEIVKEVEQFAKEIGVPTQRHTESLVFEEESRQHWISSEVLRAQDPMD